MKIGFIGLGNIGGACAANLADSKFEFYVHDLKRTLAQPLLAQGACWCDSSAEIAATCDVLFLSLPGPEQVRAVMQGEQGVLNRPNSGLVVVDLSTISLSAAREVAAAAAEAGVAYLDCPVSGGIWGAQSGDLVLMPSGDKRAFEKALPAMQVIGKEDTAYLGESGTGTLVKLINNQVFLVGGQIFQEGYLMAAKAGIDINVFADVLRQSSAALYMPLASMVTKRQWEESSYDLSLAEKDLRLAVDSATDLGVHVPVARSAHETLTKALELGLGDKFFLATMEALEAQSSFVAPAVDIDQ